MHQKHLRYLAVEVCETVLEINLDFIPTILFNLKNGRKFLCLLQDQQDMELIHFCSEAIFFGIIFPSQSKIVKHQFIVHVMYVADNSF